MPSSADGKTLTPRTMSMSSTRPRMPPSRRRKPGRTRTAGWRGLDRPSGSGAAASRGAQVRQHELASSARPDVGVDHLGDELGLVHVETGLRRALEAVGAHLGHARVVVGAGAPGLLDAGPHRGDPRAGLARVHGGADAEPVERHAALARDLGQVQRVGRRAAHRGGASVSAARRCTESCPPPGIAGAGASPLEPAQNPRRARRENRKKIGLPGPGPAPAGRTPAPCPPLQDSCVSGPAGGAAVVPVVRA